MGELVLRTRLPTPTVRQLILRTTTTLVAVVVIAQYVCL